MKFLSGLVLGFIIGVVTVVVVMSDGDSSLVSNKLEPNQTMKGLSLFEEPGECITKNTITVFQTILQNAALARVGENYDDQLVLLINYEGLSYYDDQKISLPKGKCARQLGVYSYETKMDFKKTVPVVVIQ